MVEFGEGRVNVGTERNGMELLWADREQSVGIWLKNTARGRMEKEKRQSQESRVAIGYRGGNTGCQRGWSSRRSWGGKDNNKREAEEYKWRRQWRRSGKQRKALKVTATSRLTLEEHTVLYSGKHLEHQFWLNSLSEHSPKRTRTNSYNS